jgi:NADPH:quinone reductase-like Zn-dependent oxidoreductase
LGKREFVRTQAQRIHELGSPDVIVPEDVELPRPGPLEVLVEVRAAGVGPWDALVRTGHSGIPQPLPLTLGSDLAGVVLDTGIDVIHLASGVQVYGDTNARFVGAYARHAIADATRLARKPAGVTFVEAGSLPVVAVTAWTILFEYGAVTRGSRVLVHGAAGSVGALTVQMAHAAGAIVTALARPEDASYLRSLGADVIGTYTADAFYPAIEPVDLVIDTIGAEMQRRSYSVLKPGGLLISSVQPPDQDEAAKCGVRAHFFIVDVSTRVLDLISTMLAEKTIVPNVGLVLPFAEARRAHELLAKPERRMRGKMVLTMEN